ncbi:hypothetical protein KCP74_03270 [Salmonella enterica subsp. enterica]|nr:hypothetical protein KCP74_03270 [Salmonella enterica subsp. enterica]
MASYWTSGERRVVSRGIVALLFSTVYNTYGERNILCALLGTVAANTAATGGSVSYLAGGIIIITAGGRMVLLCSTVCLLARRAAEMRNSMAVAAGGFTLTALFALPVILRKSWFMAGINRVLALRGGLSLRTLIWRVVAGAVHSLPDRDG